MWIRNVSPLPRQRRGISRLLPILLTCGLLLPAADLPAQVKRWVMPDSVLPIRPLYNVGDDEFIVGALFNKPLHDGVDSVGVVWEFARWLHASDWIWSEGFSRGDGDTWLAERNMQMDTLALLAQEGERFSVGSPPFDSVGGNGGGAGQMMEAYLFDSVQSPYIRWEFIGRDDGKGRDTTNAWYRKIPNENIDEKDWPWPDYHTRERLYDDPGDAGLIAEHFAVGYDGVADWQSHIGGSEHHKFVSYVLLHRRSDEPIPISVAIKAHLYEDHDTSIVSADTILQLFLVHAIPPGKWYLADNGDTLTDSVYREIVIDSFAVTKGELMRDFPDVAAAKYRDVSFTTDLRYRFNNAGLRGPLHPSSPTRGSSGSRALDVKVVWTGKEKVAVRSVMLRNKVAEFIYGQRQQSIDFRAECLDSARRLLHGLDAFGNPDLSAPVRTSILRLDSGHEPSEFGLGAYRAINRLFRDSLAYNGGADSVPAGLIDANPWIQPQINHLANHDMIQIEHAYMDFDWALPSDIVSIPFTEIPSIAEHNGGRIGDLVGPPELKLTPDSVDLYTQTIQRGLYGYYTSSFFQSNHSGRTIRDLAVGAHMAREHGNRMVGMTGLVSRLFHDTLASGTEIIGDSLAAKAFFTRVNHMPEVSEIRLATNLVLCYGGRGQTYYWIGTNLNPLGSHRMVFPTSWRGFNMPDTIVWGGTADFTITGESLSEVMSGTSTDVVDLELISHMLWPMIPDVPEEGRWRDTVENLWVGWKSRPEGLRIINARSKLIGSEIARRGLRWRDGYSVHNQAAMPNSSDTLVDTNDPKNTFTTRPLPSHEIVNCVRARHPVTGVVDSSWATYVELGHFYTIADTSDDPMLDTNHVYVVNRRTFERPADVPDTSARGRLMDTLAESRTLEIFFRLKNPDSLQYSFIRVREVLPDTAQLPLIGARHALDTVIHGMDSAVLLTLGPGAGALLEVTYLPGDESIVDGKLAWNNQRKMIFHGDDRWHATYLRNDSILYRRSMAAGNDPDPGSILWEPVETVVSIDTISARTYNWPPSMTMRVAGGDTIVSIVWTCHSNDIVVAAAGGRDVVVRDINLSDGTLSNIWPVDVHYGRDSTQWGDAVICAAHGGDIIAWGDSLAGVLARVRRLAPFFGSAPVYSARDSVSWDYHASGAFGRWPSVPAFAHIAAVDSNCGIAWNHYWGSLAGSDILYKRIEHYDSTGWALPGIRDMNAMAVSGTPDDLGRPSIDQSQDVWHRVQEGITWVRDRPGSTPSEIWFRSMYTPTNARPGWDLIDTTQGWALASTTASAFGANGDSRPTTGSLNEVRLVPDSAKIAHFSVAFVNHNGGGVATGLLQAMIQYSEPTFKSGWPKSYAYVGDYPQASASPVSQQYRHGVLYETTAAAPTKVLRTTRQFFGARLRPGGYVAGGRRVAITMSQAPPSFFTVMMHDPWMIDAAGVGRSLEMSSRSYAARVDSLPHVAELMRTAYFTAHDTTDIGLQIGGRFGGDSATAGAASVTAYAELVDSASGTVVQTLDTFALTAASPAHELACHDVVDLLSGTYYIRLRLDTASLTAVARFGDMRYPIAEHASYVEETPASKRVQRLDGEAGNGLRLSAQPNPFAEETEIRFSIPRGSVVTLRVFDASGRVVAELLEGESFDAGRYAAALESANLSNGSYIVELRAGEERITTQVVLQR